MHACKRDVGSHCTVVHGKSTLKKDAPNFWDQMVFIANVENSSDSYILYAGVIELVNSKIRPEQFPPSVQAGQIKEMQRSTHGL